MSIISNNSKLKIYSLIISFSLVFTEFYFFNWKTQFFVSNGYLIFNTLILFFFSLLLFSFSYFIYSKTIFYLPEKIVKLLDLTILTIVLFKLIQILFFYANKIHFKSLVVIFLKKVFSGNLFFLIPFLKIILPYFLIFIFIFILKKKYIEIIINFIISFSIVFFLLMVFDISKRTKNIFYNNFQLNSSNNERKVVWIVLDEYDPSYIENEHGLELKHTKKIISNSIIQNRTFAPSDATLYSAPSTLMKTKIKDLIFEDYKMKVLDNNNKKIDFSIENTIFQKLIDNSYSFHIFSEALPYCTMLRIKNNCEKNYNQLKFYFDGIINTLTPIKYFPKIFDILNKRSNFDISKLNELDIKNDKEIYLSKELNINIDKFDDLLQTDNNLFYFHLFLPHTNNKGHLVSSKHIRDKFNMNANTDLEHQKENNEILLLLTSDHWRRVDSPQNPKPSLFIAKIFGDNLGYQLNNDVLNIFIPDLINDFLEKKIKTHDQIKLFIDNLPLFDFKTTHLY
jgi:hypothetical protein